MIYVLLLFWYTYDDWLAAVTNTPWLGEVNFWIWFVLWLASASSSD